MFCPNFITENSFYRQTATTLTKVTHLRQEKYQLHLVLAELLPLCFPLPIPLSSMDQLLSTSITVAELEDGRSDPEQGSAALLLQRPTRGLSVPLVAAGS